MGFLGRLGRDDEVPRELLGNESWPAGSFWVKTSRPTGRCSVRLLQTIESRSEAGWTLPLTTEGALPNAD